MSYLETLEKAVDDAEGAKRAFVRNNTDGGGDKAERAKKYRLVEAAREALRKYKEQLAAKAKEGQEH